MGNTDSFGYVPQTLLRFMSWFKTGKKENTSMGELSDSIISYSFLCAEQLQDYFDELPEEEREQRRVYVSLEFTYFWMHVANMTAYNEIGNENRIKLQGELGPLVIRPIVETLFSDLTEKMREPVVVEIFEKLNEAALEYANCKNLPPEGDLYEDETIFSKLATNVAQVFDQTQNSELLKTILNLTLITFNQIGMKNLINAASMEL